MKADLSSDTFKTIKSFSSGTYKEKGSRFIAAAFPVTGEEEIRSALEETRKEHHNARHNCYAYILGRDGSACRANDDGEPSGTAGKPILGQIRSYGLCNVLIVVSRYFGGTLLGVSGLINAYKTAAGSALEGAEIIDHVIHESYEIRYPYPAMNEVMKIIKDESITQCGHVFDLECMIKISFRLSAKERILDRLSRVEGLSWEFLGVR
jgi:uncharacterized YigZ family protein